MSENDTQPMLDTILRELREFRTDMGIRLDRIESFAHQTRSELLALRADVKELRKEFEGFRSQFKQPA
jgi:hypothetical protein